MPSIAVFCGARLGANPRYSQDARALGTALAERGWSLVYGGGRVGLMGAVAQACLDAGGEVIGVIPHFLATREVLHPDLHVNHQVTDLFERKALMMALADAFIGLPGGIGTFDEVLEVIAWRQLGQSAKPVVLLNTVGYFNPWQSLLDHAIEQGFVDPLERERLWLFDTVPELLDALEPGLNAVPAP